MKKPQILAGVLALALLLAVVAGSTHAQGPGPGGEVSTQATLMGTAFTYQGELKAGGEPVDDDCDMAFRLYDHPSVGSRVGSAITRTVPISGGLFTVVLDFGGGIFTGDARWLGIRVKCSGDGDFTSLTPRQALTPAPYALNADLLDGQHASAFWKLTGNSGTTPGTHFLGTADNQALEFKVNGARVLRLEPDATSPNLIGGYSGNSVAVGVVGGTIGGGGASGNTNRVTDEYGTVGGGYNNQAGDNAGTTLDAAYATVGGGFANVASHEEATVGGGYGNYASGFRSTVGGGVINEATGPWATVAGGAFNIASGEDDAIGGGYLNRASGGFATVGGGYHNNASGGTATIGGGWHNTASDDVTVVGGGLYNIASADGATVPGGIYNAAEGYCSFAAGRQAKANHGGAFVWGDSTEGDVNSSGEDQFIVRANGGIWFGAVTTEFTPTIGSGVLISTSTGAYLSTGGTWTDASDQGLKENFSPVDAREVLVRLTDLPITTWNYKAEGPSIRHMGPVAQDFYATFGLGQDERHIASLDTGGVALAAIQALYEHSQALEAENVALREQVTALREENAAQQAQIDDLGARVAALEGAPTSGTPMLQSGLESLFAGTW